LVPIRRLIADMEDLFFDTETALDGLTTLTERISLDDDGARGKHFLAVKAVKALYGHWEQVHAAAR
jgi:hypothetical protein